MEKNVNQPSKSISFYIYFFWKKIFDLAKKLLVLAKNLFFRRKIRSLKQKIFFPELSDFENYQFANISCTLLIYIIVSCRYNMLSSENNAHSNWIAQLRKQDKTIDKEIRLDDIQVLGNNWLGI